MVAKPLPYDMGNAGDFIKHGLLAEFTEWWCCSRKRNIRFVDPFGGRPWVEPVNPDVVTRITSLRDCALLRVQSEIEKRYYGSGQVVLRAAKNVRYNAEVYVSDQDPEAVNELINSGLKQFKKPGFNAKDGFSILDINPECDLALLDPFSTFLRDDSPKAAFGRNQRDFK